MSAETDMISRTVWPDREEKVNADALIIHAARTAMALQATADALSHVAFSLKTGDPEYRPAMRSYIDAVEAFIHEAQVAELLVAVQSKDPEFADLLALRIWELTEDGGALSERLWQHLDERGIDADQVWLIAEESANKKSDPGVSA